jgi:hypothetical protein
MKAYKRSRIIAALTSAPDGGVWLVTRPGYSNPKETAPVSIEWDDIRAPEDVEKAKMFFIYSKLEHNASDVTIVTGLFWLSFTIYVNKHTRRFKG